MKNFFSVLTLIVFSFNLHSQSQNNSTKSIKAYKIDREEIILDGKLDELFWNNVKGIDEFLMQEPVEGNLPTENTLIKIAYDENYLYIGAIMYDSDPKGIKSFKMKKDSPLNTDDRFMWILDTYLDGRNAYFLK